MGGGATAIFRDITVACVAALAPVFQHGLGPRAALMLFAVGANIDVGACLYLSSPGRVLQRVFD